MSSIRRAFTFAALVLLSACAPKSTSSSASTNLVGHTYARYSYTSGGQSYVICTVYYTDSTKNAGVQITFDAATLVTCAGQALTTVDGAFYSGSVVSGGASAVSVVLLRPNDGSSIVSTVPVY